MQIKATTVDEYLAEVPAAQQPYFNQLRQTIVEHLPKGFEQDFKESTSSPQLMH